MILLFYLLQSIKGILVAIYIAGFYNCSVCKKYTFEQELHFNHVRYRFVIRTQQLKSLVFSLFTINIKFHCTQLMIHADQRILIRSNWIFPYINTKIFSSDIKLLNLIAFNNKTNLLNLKAFSFYTKNLQIINNSKRFSKKLSG